MWPQPLATPTTACALRLECAYSSSISLYKYSNAKNNSQYSLIGKEESYVYVLAGAVCTNLHEIPGQLSQDLLVSGGHRVTQLAPPLLTITQR